MRCVWCVVLLVAGWSHADPIEVGPETTVFEGPVRADGTVDYLAALNAAGQTIDPADNAAVVLAAWMDQEVGRWAWSSPAFGEATLAALGWPGADPGITMVDPAWLGAVVMEPGWWREPGAAAWLRANERAIDAVRDAAATRAMYWWPSLGKRGGSGLLADVLLPQLGASRRFARVLGGRAMLRVEAGDAAGAWADVRGMLQWGDRIAGGEWPAVIEVLVGVSLRALARQTLEAVIDAAPGELLAEMQAELAAWPRGDEVVRSIRTERLMGVDI